MEQWQNNYRIYKKDISFRWWKGGRERRGIFGKKSNIIFVKFINENNGIHSIRRKLPGHVGFFWTCSIFHVGGEYRISVKIKAKNKGEIKIKIKKQEKEKMFGKYFERNYVASDHTTYIQYVLSLFLFRVPTRPYFWGYTTQRIYI